MSQKYKTENNISYLLLDEVKYGCYAFKGYRQLIVENYIIVYEVLENEKVVAVVTVKYGKSEFQNQEISLKYRWY